jgi:hypothetical protein
MKSIFLFGILLLFACREEKFHAEVTQEINVYDRLEGKYTIYTYVFGTYGCVGFTSIKGAYDCTKIVSYNNVDSVSKSELIKANANKDSINKMLYKYTDYDDKLSN